MSKTPEEFIKEYDEEEHRNRTLWYYVEYRDHKKWSSLRLEKGQRCLLHLEEAEEAAKEAKYPSYLVRITCEDVVLSLWRDGVCLWRLND